MFEIVVAVVVLVAVILSWVCLYDMHHFVITKKKFYSPKIRKSQRFVVLSDLHGQQYGKENELLLKAVCEQEPDGVLIVGDMLTAGCAKQVKPVLSLIRKLCEKYPVYYAYGNHEQKIHGKMAESYFPELKETGVRLLLNESVRLADSGITLYGTQIDRKYFRRGKEQTMEDGYIETLLGSPCEETYNILLAHNPDYFLAYARWGADLVLSGHVHGGIVRLPFLGGVISPAMKLFPKYDGGEYREKDSVMILGRGIGTHFPGVRVFNPAEMVVLELSGKER